jgi:hypothetical protein
MGVLRRDRATLRLTVDLGRPSRGEAAGLHHLGKDDDLIEVGLEIAHVGTGASRKALCAPRCGAGSDYSSESDDESEGAEAAGEGESETGDSEPECVDGSFSPYGVDPYFKVELQGWPFEGSETELISLSCSSGSLQPRPDTPSWTVLPLLCWNASVGADRSFTLVFGSDLVNTYGAGLENRSGLSVSVQAWQTNADLFSYATIRDAQSNALLLAAAMERLSVDQPPDFEGRPVGLPVMVDGLTPEEWFSPFDGVELRDGLCPETSPPRDGGADQFERRLALDFDLADGAQRVFDHEVREHIVAGDQSFTAFVPAAWYHGGLPEDGAWVSFVVFAE